MFLGSLLLATLATASPPLVMDANGEFHLDFDALEVDPEFGLPADFDPEAIVNGTQTDGFDNVVSLAGIAQWGGYSFCSGTLIDSRWILTAAHCVVDIPDLQNDGMDVYVIWGGDVYQTATDSILMANYYPHPQYDPNCRRRRPAWTSRC